jgi:cytochrome oxidase Cu insertion factor (SCO1/SenC/PrrC family)
VFSEGLNNFHTAIGRERDRVAVSEMPAEATVPGSAAIWLVDPLGNVVLKFDPAVNPTLILNDLKKLLKLSKVG